MDQSHFRGRARVADPRAELLAILAECAAGTGGAQSGDAPGGIRRHDRRPGGAPARLYRAANPHIHPRLPLVQLGLPGVGRWPALGPGGGFSAGIPDLCPAGECARYGGLLAAHVGDRGQPWHRQRHGCRGHPQRHAAFFAGRPVSVRRGGGLLRRAFADGAHRALAAGGLSQFSPVVAPGLCVPVEPAVHLRGQCRAHFRHHLRCGGWGTARRSHRARVGGLSGFRHRARIGAAECERPPPAVARHGPSAGSVAGSVLDGAGDGGHLASALRRGPGRGGGGGCHRGAGAVAGCHAGAHGYGGAPGGGWTQSRRIAGVRGHRMDRPPGGHLVRGTGDPATRHRVFPAHLCRGAGPAAAGAALDRAERARPFLNSPAGALRGRAGLDHQGEFPSRV